MTKVTVPRLDKIAIKSSAQIFEVDEDELAQLGSPFAALFVMLMDESPVSTGGCQTPVSGNLTPASSRSLHGCIIQADRCPL